MSAPQPGDKLISVDSGWGGPTVRGVGIVKRVTPTGIIVLEDDTRLKANRFRDDSYEVRGSGGWHRAVYYPPSHEVVKAARENTRRTKAANAVHAAYDVWRSSRDAASARDLAKAAAEFAKRADA